MTDAQAAIFRKHTGRRALPTTPAREGWLVVGRRGGKSRIAALVAVYCACFRDYRPVLASGERAVVMVLAADRDQARVVLGYIAGLIESVPMLARMVSSRTAEAIHLSNRVSIEIHTASYRAIRGRTVVAAICDELAFWRSDDSANPDTEILAALRPAMATVPDPLLLCISSPFARRGALWQAHQDHFGKDGDPILVWQADTRSMNASIDPEEIRLAYERDPVGAEAEYGARFRTDVEVFVSREMLQATVISGRLALPPVAGVRYVAFVDPSGGSQDAMTLAIAHKEGDVVRLDLVAERRAPFSPDAVVSKFAQVLRRYRITRVTGDRFGGEWPRDRFRAHGITYRVADQSKSEIYGAFLPLLTSARVELLDHPGLVAEFLALDRRVARGGRESIDHPRAGRDDMANAAAGAVVAATRPPGLLLLTAPTPSGPTDGGDCPTCGGRHPYARCPFAAPTGEELRRSGWFYR